MTQGSGITQHIVEFALSPHPSTHARQSTDALLDTVAVALAGRASRGSSIAHEWAESRLGQGRATVWASGVSAAPDVAALLNGLDAHELDYDDVSPTMPMHPSAVLFPCLVAVAEDRGIPWRELAPAYDVGAAVFRAVTEVLPGDVHYGAGWHTTATVGRIAAVAALIRLGGVDAQQGAHALGMVSSMVSGSRGNFGSMTKPLHAGLAARDAVIAIELAERGFTSNPLELESTGGFLDRFGDTSMGTQRELRASFGDRLTHWSDNWVNDWGIKAYPSCFATHKAIDAALELRPRVDNVDRITVCVQPRGAVPLITGEVTTPQAAKFSMGYVVATALLTGSVTLADFTHEAFAEVERQAFAKLVTLEERELPPVGQPAAHWTTVEIKTDSGPVIARADVALGDSTKPLSREQFRSKFDDCLLEAEINVDQAARLWQELEAVGSGEAPSGPLATLASIVKD